MKTVLHDPEFMAFLLGRQPNAWIPLIGQHKRSKPVPFGKIYLRKYQRIHPTLIRNGSVRPDNKLWTLDLATISVNADLVDEGHFTAWLAHTELFLTQTFFSVIKVENVQEERFQAFLRRKGFDTWIEPSNLGPPNLYKDIRPELHRANYGEQQPLRSAKDIAHNSRVPRVRPEA